MKGVYELLAILHIVVLVVARGNGRPSGDEYAKDANVYELTPSNFDKVIHQTNYTSIVKFYAPWCGYCQQLSPTYKKLGKLIQQDGKYAANVASVNCDKDYNKPLCSKYKISGFPTLMVFRPPKYDPKSKSKAYRHTTEPYNGERSLRAMYEYVTGHIKNYVKKFPNLKSDTLKEWLMDNQESNKVILVTESQQISPLYKSLAIDFINTHKFGMLSLKSLKGIENPKLTVLSDDVESEIELPLKEGDTLPALFNLDKTTNQFVRYAGAGKLNDKVKIAEWLVKQNGKKPLEGEFSKKEVKKTKYRTGKKDKPAHDEL